jgi:hypothetical protein
MTEKPVHRDIASELAAREALRQAQHRGTPTQNESIERRISDEVTQEALRRKLERDAKKA